MVEVPPIPLAAFAGFFCAMIFASIPVGPINLTILNEGARRGFAWAFLIGLGATVMDAIYCTASFTGISQFYDRGMVKAAMQLLSFVFLLVLGAKFLFARTVKVPTGLETTNEKLEARMEQRFHPHSAFATGFLRVAANLGVPIAWVGLSAYLMSSRAFFADCEWVQNTVAAKAACIGGVITATALWFLIFSWQVSRTKGKFSEATLLRMQQASGLCLIGTAIFQGSRIVWHLSHHAH
jgi:threonine/homoserine/homoserine lactone efflux protein